MNAAGPEGQGQGRQDPGDCGKGAVAVAEQQGARDMLTTPQSMHSCVWQHNCVSGRTVAKVRLAGVVRGARSCQHIVALLHHTFVVLTLLSVSIVWQHMQSIHQRGLCWCRSTTARNSHSEQFSSAARIFCRAAPPPLSDQVLPTKGAGPRALYLALGGKLPVSSTTAAPPMP